MDGMQFINFRSMHMLFFLSVCTQHFFIFLTDLIHGSNSSTSISDIYRIMLLQDGIELQNCVDHSSQRYILIRFLILFIQESGNINGTWFTFLALAACIDCCAYTLTSVCEAYSSLEFNFLVCACITGSHVCCL